MLLTTDTIGGIWQYSLDLARGFIERGAEVLLVTLGPKPSASQRRQAQSIQRLRLLQTDLPLDWLANHPKQLIDAASVLTDIAARHHVDSVHLHTPALVHGAAWPAPVVAVAHSCVGTWWRAVCGGPLPADLAWRADAMARGLTAADAVIAPSHSFAAALTEHYSLACPPHAVRNGRRRVPAVARRNDCVLTAGRLWDRGKNIAVLDAVAARLDVPMFAAGPTIGPHGEQISVQNLRLLGTLDESAMAAAYAGTAVFASLARYEPFGLAVLEAAQAGCTLVLSDIPTFRELWEDAAVFVDPADDLTLAQTLRALLLSPMRRAELGSAARRRAASLNVECMVAGTWRIHAALHPVHATPA